MLRVLSNFYEYIQIKLILTKYHLKPSLIPHIDSMIFSSLGQFNQIDDIIVSVLGSSGPLYGEFEISQGKPTNINWYLLGFFLNAHYEREAHRKVGLGSCVLVDRNIYL
jgi:hypothetical protein